MEIACKRALLLTCKHHNAIKSLNWLLEITISRAHVNIVSDRFLFLFHFWMTCPFNVKTILLMLNIYVQWYLCKCLLLYILTFHAWRKGTVAHHSPFGIGKKGHSNSILFITELGANSLIYRANFPLFDTLIWYTPIEPFFQTPSIVYGFFPPSTHHRRETKRKPAQPPACDALLISMQ